MAGGGPPAPQLLPVIPPVVPHASLVQLPAPPAQPIVPPVQPVQPVPMLQLNWPHSKPEFAGKPDEDAETYLLRINDWMDIHSQKVPKSRDYV